jgi:hypothetical protein
MTNLTLARIVNRQRRHLWRDMLWSATVTATYALTFTQIPL